MEAFSQTLEIKEWKEILNLSIPKKTTTTFDDFLEKIDNYDPEVTIKNVTLDEAGSIFADFVINEKSGSYDEHKKEAKAFFSDDNYPMEECKISFVSSQKESTGYRIGSIKD